MRSFAVVRQYMADTTTSTGLQVRAHRVLKTYLTGCKVSDAEMAAFHIQPHPLCPQWNDTIDPRAKDVIA